MFKRLKNAIKRLPGKAKLVKFTSVGSVGMPEDMRADSDDDDEDDDEDEDEKEQEESKGEERWSKGINVYSNSAAVGSKRGRDEGASDKENRHQEESTFTARPSPVKRAPRLVIDNEPAKLTESRKKLADQLLEKKKTQVTDQRWETDRATARLVDLDAPAEDDDADLGVFNNAFYGQDAHEQPQPQAQAQAPAQPGAAAAELTGEERRQMRDYIFSKVRHNHVEIVQTCIRGQTHDLRACDDKGNSLLHLSCQNNLRKMSMLLLREGGFSGPDQLNKRNHKGMTPLDYCDLYKFEKLGNWLTLQGAERGDAQAGGGHK